MAPNGRAHSSTSFTLRKIAGPLLLFGDGCTPDFGVEILDPYADDSPRYLAVRNLFAGAITHCRK
jgi:hypothetical protein